MLDTVSAIIIVSILIMLIGLLFHESAYCSVAYLLGFLVGVVCLIIAENSGLAHYLIFKSIFCILGIIGCLIYGNKFFKRHL